MYLGFRGSLSLIFSHNFADFSHESCFQTTRCFDVFHNMVGIFLRIFEVPCLVTIQGDWLIKPLGHVQTS